MQPFCLRLIRLAGLALFVSLTSACGGNFEPFDVIPRPPSRTEIDDNERVGICYNAMFTTAEKVRDAAWESCPPNTTPLLISQDMNLSCPLLTPVRATFSCAAQ